MAHNSGFMIMMSISHDRQWFLLGVRVMNAAQYVYIYTCVSRVKWTGSDPRIGISNSSVRVLRHPFWRRNLEDLQELQFLGAVEICGFLRDPYSVNADIHVCGYFGPKGP